MGIAGALAGGGIIWLVYPQKLLISPSVQTPSSLSPFLYTYRGHLASVTSVVWSPHEQRIASGSDDSTVQVCNATTGDKAFTYHGHSDMVTAVAWSPDGKYIASASYDKTVQVWKAADGSSVYTYRGHAKAVDAVAWSPDGKRIASGSIDRTVQVWDATTA